MLMGSLPRSSVCLAADGTAPTGLLVNIDEQGKLIPLRVEQGTFEAVLHFGDGASNQLKQPWRYNIYAQFYFPGEDPAIDYTFLGNRRYPRLLQKLDRSAALIWVNSAATRSEADDLRKELARQGLEGAFVARARGDYGFEHTPAQLEKLKELAGRLDPAQCAGEDPLDWLSQQDRQRRFGMQVRLLSVEVHGSVNDALQLRDSLVAELGHCGMLNHPGGGYRLFCGAYESQAKLLTAYEAVAELSGSKPTVVCLNSDGLQTRWVEEDPTAP